MPQRGFNPRLCLGWLDELVASHAGSCRPLLSTACDTARCNQPVIEGRDNSRPFLILSGAINNICTSRRLKVAPPCPSHPPLSLTSLTTCPRSFGLYFNTQLGHEPTNACCCLPCCIIAHGRELQPPYFFFVSFNYKRHIIHREYNIKSPLKQNSYFLQG